MASVQPQHDDLDVASDDLVVEPAVTAWTRRLREWLEPGTPVPVLAERTAALLATELDAHHVALWTREYGAHVVLGASGLNPGARRTRIPEDAMAIEPHYKAGEVLRWDEGGTAGTRPRGLPGTYSPVYGLVLLDGAGPVSLLTVSGPAVSAVAMQEAISLLQSLPWRDMTS